MSKKTDIFQLRVDVAKECKGIIKNWQARLFLKNKDFTLAEVVEYIIKNYKEGK